MTLDNIETQNDNELYKQNQVSGEVFFGWIEKLPSYNKIKELYNDYHVLSYNQGIVNKYWVNYMDVLYIWEKRYINDSWEEYIREEEINDMIPKDLLDQYSEFWLIGPIYTMCNILAKHYIDNRNRSHKWKQDITPEWKIEIVNKIWEAFKAIKTKLNKKNIKENSDLFLIFTIAYIVSGKKVTYNSIKNSYPLLYSSSQQIILDNLKDKYSNLKKDLLNKKNDIEKNNFQINILSEEIKNNQNDFYFNIKLIEELQNKIEKTKEDILKDQKLKDNYLKDLKKYSNDLWKSKDIQNKIRTIDEAIQKKEKTLLLIENQKNLLQKNIFPESKEKLTQSQRIQRWLDKYGQKNFDAQTVIKSIQNAENRINDVSNKKYWESLINLKKKYPRYKVKIPVDYVMAFIFLESHFGTWWLGKKKNPGNVYNDWKKTYSFDTWEGWLEACAYNLWERILSYQELFGISDYPDSKFPTVKELAENKSRDSRGSKWFLIWIANRDKPNWYRTWKVKNNNGEITYGTLNPKWAYMVWYPWWARVESCYKKYITSDLIFDKSLEINQKEEMLKDKSISESDKEKIKQDIQKLKKEKEALEQELINIQNLEKKIESIKIDIDALTESHAVELSQAYSELENMEKHELSLREINKKVEYSIININKMIDSGLYDIRKFQSLLDNLIIIKDEINNFDYWYESDFMLSDIQTQDLDDTKFNINRDYRNLLLKLQSARDIIEKSKNSLNELSSEIDSNTWKDKKVDNDDIVKNNKVKKDVWSSNNTNSGLEKSDIVDLSKLNKLAWGIWDSIIQSMHYVWNQKNYEWFKNTKSYPWKKSSFIKDKYIENRNVFSSSKYVVVMTWFNDLDSENTWNNIDFIIKDLIMKWKTPVICSLYPMEKWSKWYRNYSFKNNQIKKWVEWHNMLQKYSGIKKWIIYADFWNFISDQDQDFKNEFYRTDGLHPTERGARQLNLFLQNKLNN